MSDEDATDPGFSPAAIPGVDGHIACTHSFECPQLWSQLPESPEAAIRYCGVCDRDVCLVWSQEMFDECAGRGDCAAVLTSGRSTASAGEPTGDVDSSDFGDPNDETLL